MPGGVSAGGVIGLLKTPWIGVVVLAFFVGTDHATTSNRLDILAHTDTVTVQTIHRDLRDIIINQDSLSAREHRHFCYLSHNIGSECAR